MSVTATVDVFRKDEPGVLEPRIDAYRAAMERSKATLNQMRAIQDPEMELKADFLQLSVKNQQAVVNAHNHGEPFISNTYSTAPEIPAAFGLPSYSLYTSTGSLLTKEERPGQMDEVIAMGIGGDLCGIIRGGILGIERGLLPIPTGVIGLITPCDGMPMLHQVMQHNKYWKDIPIVTPEPPYFRDQRNLDYFANELKKIVSFLEELTGKKLDRDRLTEVIEESNRQYELWAEYYELRRSKPCPHGFSTGGPVCYHVAQTVAVGQPEGTAWFQKVLDHAEERVEAGIGAIAEEKVRVLWFDILPNEWGSEELFPWLQEEHGAVLVNDMMTFNDYSLIDVSSEEEMWRGLAKRGLCDTPMIRSSAGSVEAMVHDLERMVKDFSIDVVIWPGHMGHKEAQGAHGILRETCKKMGVPFMELQVDLWDRSYQDPDEIKEKITRFFQTRGIG